MKKQFFSNYEIAFEAVLSHKLRSLLTALGIIFGVAAVISMLAIGNGAQEEILQQMKIVGVNNIVIKPIIEQKEQSVEATSNASAGDKQKSPGLTLYDAKAIQRIIPDINLISPEIIIESNIIKNAISRSVKLVGVENSYFNISNFSLLEGRFFNSFQLEKGAGVCVIGKGIKSKFFSQENPIGKKIKVGYNWLKVIGVLDERYIGKKSIENLGIRDYNMDVYVPLKAILLRYENRALINQRTLSRRGRNENEQNSNYHQIDRLVVQVNETEKLESVAQVLSKLLKRRHQGMVDYEITIPELLLKQQQKTKSIFNFVLGAIAGISLLVGGIGIMNIMLASVLERIKEIGLRLSVGATKTDITFQFMLEAIMISAGGGLTGIFLGVSMAYVVSSFAEIPTIITFSSIILAFGVAAGIGIIFGITPAQKAASQDPITSLRYE